jgi:hypothetical protein
LHLDRVMRCPTDLPSGVEWTPRKEVPTTDSRPPTDPDDEYVIDHLVSHAPTEDEQGLLVRVRWAGFYLGEDTWEPVTALPEHMVARYERRKLHPVTLRRRPWETPRLQLRYLRLEGSYMENIVYVYL